MHPTFSFVCPILHCRKNCSDVTYVQTESTSQYKSGFSVVSGKASVPSTVCKQVTKNGITYSLWEEIVFGVPQRSILVPLLFNIFLSNSFLSNDSNYFTDYTDDTTPYVIGNEAEEVVSEIKTIAEKLFVWFARNEMKANLTKCHVLLSTTEAFNFQISETVIHNTHSRKLLGITFDNKLKFEKPITTKCGKGKRKLHAIARVTPYMDL